MHRLLSQVVAWGRCACQAMAYVGRVPRRPSDVCTAKAYGIVRLEHRIWVTLGFAATIVHALRSLTLRLPNRLKWPPGLPTGGDRHHFLPAAGGEPLQL